MDWGEALDALGALSEGEQREGEELIKHLVSSGRFGKLPHWYSMIKIARALNCAAWDVQAVVAEHDNLLPELTRHDWLRKGLICMLAEQMAQSRIAEMANMAAAGPPLRKGLHGV